MVLSIVSLYLGKINDYYIISIILLQDIYIKYYFLFLLHIFINKFIRFFESYAELYFYKAIFYISQILIGRRQLIKIDMSLISLYKK